jgi:hypothetical protein
MLRECLTLAVGQACARRPVEPRRSGLPIGEKAEDYVTEPDNRLAQLRVGFAGLAAPRGNPAAQGVDFALQRLSLRRRKTRRRQRTIIHDSSIPRSCRSTMFAHRQPG